MNIALNHFPESERAALKKFLDGVKARTGYTVRTSGSGDREVHEFVAPRAPGPNVVPPLYESESRTVSAAGGVGVTE